jgi:hypothetical protein
MLDLSAPKAAFDILLPYGLNVTVSRSPPLAWPEIRRQPGGRWKPSSAGPGTHRGRAGVRGSG